MVPSSSLSETQFTKKKPQSLHKCTARKSKCYFLVKWKDPHLNLCITHPKLHLLFAPLSPGKESALKFDCVHEKAVFCYSGNSCGCTDVLQMKACCTTGSTHCQALWERAIDPQEDPGGKTFEQKHYTAAFAKKKSKDRHWDLLKLLIQCNRSCTHWLSSYQSTLWWGCRGGRNTGTLFPKPACSRMITD